MREIKLIKNRSDIGAGTRGSDLGIDAIEIAAINKEHHFFKEYESIDIATVNEIVYQNQKTPFAKNIDGILHVCTELSEAVKETIQQDKFPLVLSGDHSSALGTISGVKSAYPDKRIGVVWIDAHADIHSPYTTPSGNVHGMPLSAVLANRNMDQAINEVDQYTEEKWKAIENIGGITPKIQAKDIIYFGVRDTEAPEDHIINKEGIRNYKVEEVRYRGMQSCMNEALEQLSDCDLIYISFDVDSMCDSISKGTGTPVSKGFYPKEIEEIIRYVVDSKKVVCFEVVEVNPLLDEGGNKMAETAFDVLDKLVALISTKVVS